MIVTPGKNPSFNSFFQAVYPVGVIDPLPKFAQIILLTLNIGVGTYKDAL